MQSRTFMRLIMAAAALALSVHSAHAVSIDIGSPSGSGQPGSRVSFTVTLDIMVMRVAATDNRITVDPPLTILGCELAERFQTGFSQVVFEPVGCDEDPEVACTTARALIINDPPEPIAGSDVPLYSCEARVAFDAVEGTYPLRCSDPLASNPDGQPYNGTSRCADRATMVCETDEDCGADGPCRFLPETQCTDGTVAVSGPPLPTPTATPAGLTTKLAANITASDETIPLLDASAFGESGTVEVGGEKISYRAKVGDDLTGAQRGKDGTTAAEHPVGAPVTALSVNAGGSGGGRGCAMTHDREGRAAWLLVAAAILAFLRHRAHRVDGPQGHDGSGRQLS